MIQAGRQHNRYIDLLTDDSRNKSSREEHIEFYNEMSSALANRLNTADPSCRLGYEKQAENRITALCRISLDGPKGNLTAGMRLVRVHSGGEWEVDAILAKSE